VNKKVDTRDEWLAFIAAQKCRPIFVYPLTELLNIDINVDIAIFHQYRIVIVSKPNWYQSITNRGPSNQFPTFHHTTPH